MGGVNGYTIRKVLLAPMYLWLRSSPCSNLQHGPTSLTLAKPYMRPPHRHMWAYAGEVQDPTNSNEVRRPRQHGVSWVGGSANRRKAHTNYVHAPVPTQDRY